MDVIYKPKGEAGEYAGLALNYYTGCIHRCKYCYNTTLPWQSAEKYFSGAQPKINVLDRIRKDCEKLQGTDCPEILLSFVGDPYCPEDKETQLTRSIIALLIDYGLPFTILTKGGVNACRDFDLLDGYKKCSFGSTVCFLDEAMRRKWEPGAESIFSRKLALQVAHAAGIKTWVSLEPVIDPDQAIWMIKVFDPIVDHWKIGKINHYPEIEKKVDWKSWRDNKLLPLLKDLGADYYLKRSLSEL